MSSLRDVLSREFSTDKEAFECSQKGFLVPVQNVRAAKYYFGMLCKFKYNLSAIESNICLDSLEEDDRTLFPLKDFKAARIKVNVFLRDIYLKNKGLILCDILKIMASDGEWNDTAVCWLLWATLASEHIPHDAVCFFIKNRWNIRLLKQISNTCKSLGITRENKLWLFTEMITLGGRGITKDNDPWDDVRTRVSKKAFLNEKAAIFDRSELRTVIQKILQSEIKRKPQWPDRDEHWGRRWAYTKSGAHQQRIANLVDGVERVDLPNPNRRNFAETQIKNVIGLGTPAVHAGVSVKQEAGKDRWIYGCDTVSYFTFDYLLAPIERVWIGKSVLLKPASNGMYPSYVKWSESLGDIKLMFDYDDFNSQHTIDAIEILYEEAFADAPSDIRDWAVKSARNEWVHWTDPRTGKQRVEKKVGTLFSGHRATTFINSVLNAAYMRIVLGDDYFTLDSALHTGDDILMSTNSPEVAERVVTKVVNNKNSMRMNPSKQAMGKVTAEFLRCSFTKNEGIGYVSRAISSFVCGNWTTENALGSYDYLNAILQNLWTIMLRSGSNAVGVLVLPALQRRVPALNIEHVCFRSSIGGSPVYKVGQRHVIATSMDHKVVRERIKKNLPANATQDYINRYVNTDLIKEAGITIGELKAMMLEASYANTAKLTNDATSGVSQSQFFDHIETFTKWPKPIKGALESIFPLAQLKNRLTKDQLRRLLTVLDYELNDDLYRQAWGQPVHLVNMQTAVPFGDTRSIQHRVYHNTRVFVTLKKTEASQRCEFNLYL